MSSRSNTGCTMMSPSTFLRATSFLTLLPGEVVVQERDKKVDIVAFQDASQGAVQRAVIQVHPQLVVVQGEE